MAPADPSDRAFQQRRQLAALGFLAALVLSQLGFFAVLEAGRFWTGYFGNAVLWTVAFGMWSRLLAPVQTYRGLLNALLFFLVLGGEIGAWYLAQGYPDSAYCSTLPNSAREATCFISPETQDAGGFFGFFFVPVTLITLVVAITTTLREPPVQWSEDTTVPGESAPAPIAQRIERATEPAERATVPGLSTPEPIAQRSERAPEVPVPRPVARPIPAESSREGSIPTWLIAAGLFVLAFIAFVAFILLNMRPPT